MDASFGIQCDREETYGDCSSLSISKTPASIDRRQMCTWCSLSLSLSLPASPRLASPRAVGLADGWPQKHHHQSFSEASRQCMVVNAPARCFPITPEKQLSFFTIRLPVCFSAFHLAFSDGRKRERGRGREGESSTVSSTDRACYLGNRKKNRSVNSSQYVDFLSCTPLLLLNPISPSSQTCHSSPPSPLSPHPRASICIA